MTVDELDVMLRTWCEQSIRFAERERNGEPISKLRAEANSLYACMNQAADEWFREN